MLTALYPVWFAQSTLAHADIFAAAFTLWGLVYALPDQDRRPRRCRSVVHRGGAVERDRHRCSDDAGGDCCGGWISLGAAMRKRRWSEAGWLASCALPLIAWYGWHFSKTGFVFGNPAFLNTTRKPTSNRRGSSPRLGIGMLHLTAHMNMFVPMLLTIAALMLKPRLDAEGQERPRISSPILWRIFLILLANVVLFSVLGGALLTRYLLPMYPLVLLVAVSTFSRRVPFWQTLASLSAVAFHCGPLH